MKLSDLEKLNSLRTRSRWELNIYGGNIFLSHPRNGVVITGDDMDFITAMANHADALLEVVKAAKYSIAAAEELDKKFPPNTTGFAHLALGNLRAALEKLEGVK